MDQLFLQIRFSYVLNVCHLLKADHVLCLREYINQFSRKHFILFQMSLLIEVLNAFSTICKLFQQLKFQLLRDDLLFQCRFIYLFFFFVIFQKNYDIDYLKFFMFYRMVDKCLMTQGQQRSIFWQEAGHWEICSYQHNQPRQITFED